MTKDEIMNMPAGREMDALVAQSIMGCVDISLYRDIWTHGLKGYRQVVEHYSTDISDAWEVVEFIEKNTEYWAIGKKYLNNDYSVEFAAGGKKSEEIHADSAPLAICRAALLATMDKEKDA